MTFFTNVRKPDISDDIQAAKSISDAATMELYEHINAARVLMETQQVLCGPVEREYADKYDYADVDFGESSLWYLLFTEAHSVDPALAEKLEQIRERGTRLVPDKQFGYVLQPIIDLNYAKGWQSQAEYDDVKKCLKPHAKTLIWALGKIAGRVTTLDGFNPAIKPSEDPRPDLTEDTFEWCQFLYMAYGISKNLYEVLRFFRSQGTRLQKDLFYGYRMTPQTGQMGHVWPSEKLYKEMRDKWLQPYQTEITDLLKRLAG